MQIQSLESSVCIADAVTVDDLTEIASEGFTTVICHRRPGEADDFAGPDKLRQRAEALGLSFHDIPVAPGEYDSASIEAMGHALEQSSGPALAFCRTGRRAVHLWAQARNRQPGYDQEMILEAVDAAGHDPEPVRTMIQQ